MCPVDLSDALSEREFYNELLIKKIMPYKILKNASFIEDDHPHLRLLGGGRRGLWHGVRG